MHSVRDDHALACHPAAGANLLDLREAKRRLARGGFSVPKPPLFPHEDGRRRQRA
jgi:hypothetical protein